MEAFLEYPSSGTGGRQPPIPLGHYRRRLRRQTTMTVALPKNSRSTKRRIIVLTLLSASNWKARALTGLSQLELEYSFREPALPISARKDSVWAVRRYAPSSQRSEEHT